MYDSFVCPDTMNVPTHLFIHPRDHALVLCFIHMLHPGLDFSTGDELFIQLLEHPTKSVLFLFTRIMVGILNRRFGVTVSATPIH